MGRHPLVLGETVPRRKGPYSQTRPTETGIHTMTKPGIAAALAAASMAFIGQVHGPCMAQNTPAPERPLPGAVERAIVKLRNGQRAVRDEGVRELSAAGRPAVAPLMDVLSEHESAVRTAATESLALIGRPAVKALIRGLEHADPNQRRSAARALRLIVCSSGMGPGSASAAGPSRALRCRSISSWSAEERCLLSSPYHR